MNAGLQRYLDAFVDADRDNIARKLGLAECRDEDLELMQALQALMQVAEIDMTLFFRALSDAGGAQDAGALADVFYDDDKREAALPALDAWLQRYTTRLADDPLAPGTRRDRMRAANPKYVLRNYLAQQAIDRAEAGDDAGVRELLDVMRRPYDDQPGREAFAAKRPDWARTKAGCSMLSCSS